MNEPKTSLSTRDLAIGYTSGRTERIVAKKLNLELHPGQMVCLLGPNGAGKSTLMRTIAGLQLSLSGQVMIDEHPLDQLSPRELALKLSLVLTERIEAGNLTVNEVVTLGRTPYTGWMGKLSTDDHQKIHWAIEATNISEFSTKRIHQLSDGERQKVMLARALAQDTKIILLDEPTAHLDLPSRVEMMHLLHQLARHTNKAILLSTHELDLALQAADQLWLMNQYGEMTTGVPEDLVLNGAFESAFSKTGFYFDKKTGGFTIHRDAPSINLSLSGPPDLVFWTKRALSREAINTNTDDTAPIKILAKQGLIWLLDCNGIHSKHHTLSGLIKTLKTQMPILAKGK
jgi:iron complex transport system ATP-binding protein